MLINVLFFITQVELLSGGVNMPVTPINVYEYVRKYAEHRMLVVAEQPLHVSQTLLFLPHQFSVSGNVFSHIKMYISPDPFKGNEEGFVGCTS